MTPAFPATEVAAVNGAKFAFADYGRYVFACLLALFLVLGRPAVAQGRGPSDEEKERMRVKIGITREQQAQLDAAWIDFRKQSDELEQKMNDLRKQLYTQYEQYDFDRQAAGNLRRQIHVLYHKRMQLFAENQERIRKILNKEQFDKLQAAIREQHEQWQREHPRPQRGGPRPGPPPGG